MRGIKFFVLVVFIFSILFQPLYATIYGTISGKVTDEETGTGVPNVGVHVYGRVSMTIDTDKNGKYKFKKLRPGKYTISFFPMPPHCDVSMPEIVYVGPGENVVFNKVVKLGGTISGKVFKAEGMTPFKGVYIRAFGRGAGSEDSNTTEDGSYFLQGRLCPSSDYFITADCKIPGYAYKVIVGITVEKVKNTEVRDIVFDLNDITGIEGHITSSIDGGPIANASIAFINKDILEPLINEPMLLGAINTDENGYYYLKNLVPGDYLLHVLPPRREGMALQEWSLLIEKKYKNKEDVVVTKGTKIRVDIKLDVPSS